MAQRTYQVVEPPAPGPEADRRESARVPIRLMVRQVALGGSFDEHDGNLGLGGVFFAAAHPPAGTRLELRFVLPGMRGEVHAEGELLRVSRVPGGRFGAHVRFVDLALEAELAIARYIQRVAGQ